MKYLRNGLTPADRLWAKVDKTEGCWLWRGGTDHFGYGKIRWNGPQITTHRASYELEHGPIPDGLCVLHRCDVPACVNPAHLYLGTKADNGRDMAERHRYYSAGLFRGRPKSAVLSEETVALIKATRPRGRQAAALAAELGVHQRTVERVVEGRTYR